jgi:hypothetical protein
VQRKGFAPDFVHLNAVSAPKCSMRSGARQVADVVSGLARLLDARDSDKLIAIIYIATDARINCARRSFLLKNAYFLTLWVAALTLSSRLVHASVGGS